MGGRSCRTMRLIVTKTLNGRSFEDILRRHCAGKTVRSSSKINALEDSQIASKADDSHGDRTTHQVVAKVFPVRRQRRTQMRNLEQQLDSVLTAKNDHRELLKIRFDWKTGKAESKTPDAAGSRFQSSGADAGETKAKTAGNRRIHSEKALAARHWLTAPISKSRLMLLPSGVDCSGHQNRHWLRSWSLLKQQADRNQSRKSLTKKS